MKYRLELVLDGGERVLIRELPAVPFSFDGISVMAQE